MSEQDLYIMLIPSIAKMIVILRKFNVEEYAEYKQDVLAATENEYPSALGFIQKMFIVIETYLKEEVCAV